MPYARPRTSAGIPCNDTRNVDRHEMMLIRAGHHLWRLKSLETVTIHERDALGEALETIWEAKRQYRAELGVRLAAESAAFAARMKGR